MDRTVLNYAAHWLRFENYLAPYPLIALQDSAVSTLTSFTEELPSTIFIDGIICLRRSSSNSFDYLDREQCEVVDINRINELLSYSYQGLELILPN